MDGGFLNDEMKRDIEESIFCLIEVLYKQLSQGSGENKETKFFSHQLMHFHIQLCVSLLSYIKIT
jgi:hypothetical protein